MKFRRSWKKYPIMFCSCRSLEQFGQGEESVAVAAFDKNETAAWLGFFYGLAHGIDIGEITKLGGSADGLRGFFERIAYEPS